MFLDNKYTKWYYLIIDRARNRTLTTYAENHHIIPRSLNGTDDSTNLVLLTAREHYIVHVLLTRMVTGVAVHKMYKAAWMMACRTLKDRDYKVNSRIYERLRIEHSNSNSREERRKKISESMKRHHAANPWTDEMKAAARERALKNLEKSGWKPKDKERKVKEPKPRKPKVTRYVTCPHCGKTCDASNAKRWHLDNCQSLPGAVPVKIPKLSEANLKRWAKKRECPPK